MQSLTESDALNAVFAVVAVEESKAVIEADNYLYVAIVDTSTCTTCLDHEQSLYNSAEIDSEFPDATAESENVIHPNVHLTLWGADTCRCRLFRYGGSGIPKRLKDEEYGDFLDGLLSLGYISAAVYAAIMARKKKAKEEE